VPCFLSCFFFGHPAVCQLTLLDQQGSGRNHLTRSTARCKQNNALITLFLMITRLFYFKCESSRHHLWSDLRSAETQLGLLFCSSLGFAHMDGLSHIHSDTCVYGLLSNCNLHVQLWILQLDSCKFRSWQGNLSVCSGLFVVRQVPFEHLLCSIFQKYQLAIAP
jgi:hypothetical protein